MAKDFGNTWWGEAWLNSLSNLDYENRIPRGATYARKGNVLNVKIDGNVITAKVRGSRVTPYKVTIVVPPFHEEQVERLMERIIRRPALIPKLLSMDLDPEILTIAESCGLRVFPKMWTDLKMACNCPDWAVPCKHLAAVIYMVSREIDKNPFLVFEMHRVDLIAELKKRDIEIETKSTLEVTPFRDLLKTDPASEIKRGDDGFHNVDFSNLQDIFEPLVNLLPENPVFYNSGDFRQKYHDEMSRIVRNTKRLFKKNLSIDSVVGTGMENMSIGRNESLSFEVDGMKGCRVERTDDSGNSGMAVIDEIAGALFQIPKDLLNDYHPTVIALHQALFCALHLLSNGAVVPQIVRLEDKSYAIQWLPAYVDTEVRKTVSSLDANFPAGTVKARIGKRKKAAAISNQAEMAVSCFLDILIPALSNKIDSDKYLQLFFKKLSNAFSGVGEKESAGSIKNWLGRYYITACDYRPVFIVDETSDYGFEMHIGIEGLDGAENDMVMVGELLCNDIYQKESYKVLKELFLLTSLVSGLDDYINQGGEQPMRFDCESFAPFIFNSLPAIRLLDIKVLLPKSLQEIIHPRPTISIMKKKIEGSGMIRMDQLLDFKWQVAVGDSIMDIEEFEKMLQQASGLMRFKQNYIYADAADLEKIHKAMTHESHFNGAQMLHVALSGEYEGAPVVLTEDARSLIRELTTQEDIPVPGNVCATLRPYQERGFSWMYRNMRIGFGSVIADDMGLGKTLQVITLLQKLKNDFPTEPLCALVVVPTGLLTNWEAEIRRFAPSLSSFVYHGTGRDFKQFDADIMLTTYGVLRSDVNTLKRHKWNVMVIDEAQNIKNPETAQSKAVRSIPANVHIAMSGTPVENRLTEFWSIMDFANKGYLSTLKQFKEDFASPIQVFGDMKCAERFRKITAPFMMRRLKSDKTIISDLPDKVEQNDYALLTPKQAALYEKTLEAAIKAIEEIESVDSQSLFKRQGLVLQMILALKQICNHPAQYLKNGDFDPELSGKTQLFLDLVSSIVNSGEKVLVFTQYKEMGEMLQHFIEQRLDIRPMFYHGGSSVKERQTMVDRFQNNKSDQIFLLSLKAAGTGLNLTAATHVIHYDLWWNPAVEAQATDRAYRIGQKKNVVVHRFITKNTFEERIDQMIQQKKHLADMTVASGESWIGKLSNEELREIFG